MVVGRVGGGIAGLRELCAIDAGEPPKVVIERVVLLHDDDHVLHQIRCGHHTFPMPESVPRTRTFPIESTLILPWKHIQTRRRCGGRSRRRRAPRSGICDFGSSRFPATLALSSATRPFTAARARLPPPLG